MQHFGFLMGGLFMLPAEDQMISAHHNLWYSFEMFPMPIYHNCRSKMLVLTKHVKV